jgi:hypothetical protein
MIALTFENCCQFPEDERSGLINSVSKEVKEKGLPDSKDAMWSYYIEQCRDNLHIILAMSPVGDDLRRRCRNFPGTCVSVHASKRACVYICMYVSIDRGSANR